VYELQSLINILLRAAGAVIKVINYNGPGITSTHITGTGLVRQTSRGSSGYNELISSRKQTRATINIRFLFEKNIRFLFENKWSKVIKEIKTFLENVGSRQINIILPTKIGESTRWVGTGYTIDAILSTKIQVIPILFITKTSSDKDTFINNYSLILNWAVYIS